MATIHSEATLLPLLNTTPLDHTLYLALADIAEENGDLDRAKVWRMFYFYKVCPCKHPFHQDKAFAWMHCGSNIQEITANYNSHWLKSADGEVDTIVGFQQWELCGRSDWWDTRQKAILALLECVLKHPEAFQKELSKV